MKNKRLLIPITAAIIILVLIYAVRTGLLGRKEVSAESPSLKRSAKKSTYLDWGKNPFNHEKIRLFILNGIMISEGSPVAVINNDIFEVGDTLEGNRIIEIKKDRVILSDGVTTFTLFTSPGDVSIER